jgi:hypothetical protein
VDVYQQKYYKKAVLISKLLACLPTVVAILLNGSIAQGSGNKSSDIDLLIITKSHRLWTARFFVLLCLTFLGLKRSKDHTKSHAGKICANYFLADNYLKIPTGRGKQMDNYCADNYSRSVLLAGDKKVFEKFFWVNKKLFEQKTVIAPKGALWAESSLLARGNLSKENIGNRIEKMLKYLQIRKIEQDPITNRYPNLIVYNDLEARFHPPKMVW